MAIDKNTELTKSTTSSNVQIIVFKLGEEEYGLHIDQIKEVVITPQITKMPQTPSFIKGVANIRGNIIAILDLEEKFELKKLSHISEQQHNYTLVIESEEFKMGILVKEVPNTLTIKTSDIEESFGNQEGLSDQGYLNGIVKLDKRLIIMIDIYKVLTEGELNQTFRKGTATAA